MPLRVVPYTSDLAPAGCRFNQRMREGNAPTDFLLPEEGPGEPHYIAIDELGEARGGIIIQKHAALLNDEAVTVVNLQSPLSEGIVNPKYALVVSQLLRHALKVSPFAYVVGMGAVERPLPRVLKALGWRVVVVPFYFRLLRAGRCFRQIQPLRREVWKRRALDLVAFSGLAPVAGLLLHRARPQARATASALPCTPSAGWDASTAEAWKQRLAGLSFAVQRDVEGARALYRTSLPGMHAFRAGSRGWWFSLQVTHMRGNPYFGDLVVATLADVVGPRQALSGLVLAAANQARTMGAELLVANFQDTATQHACIEAGMKSGPSNYLWATSPKLSEAALPETSYVSRRDGDGLVNLSGANAG